MVLEFRTGEVRDYTLMDPTNAYPKKEVKGWRRHIILEKPVITVILDEVKSEKNAEIETRFHTACSTEIGEGYVLLKGNKGTMALIPVTEGDYCFREGKNPFLPVQKNAAFQWIPYFGTVLHAKNEKTIVATLVMPVEEKTEALKIVESIERKIDDAGNMILSFKHNGNFYSYTFKETRDGLILSK